MFAEILLEMLCQISLAQSLPTIFSWFIMVSLSWNGDEGFPYMKEIQLGKLSNLETFVDGVLTEDLSPEQITLQ